MPISDKFQKRLKLLRTTYQLSHQEITDYLNMKSRTNISNWELGKNMPSLDILCDITLLFGVRPDWILGYVDSPYDNEIMLSIEDELLNCCCDNTDTKQYTIDWIPDEYKNPQMRAKTYSMEVRANIIYLLKRINNFNNIKTIYSLESHQFNRKINTNKQQKIQLHTLLAARKLAIPLWDLKHTITI